MVMLYVIAYRGMGEGYNATTYEYYAIASNVVDAKRMFRTVQPNAEIVNIRIA